MKPGLGRVLAQGILMGWLAALVSGCATLRQDLPPPVPSHALAPDPSSPLGRLAAGHLAQGGGPSAFRLLESGQAALLARMALIERSRHSLDLQYYIFRADLSGKLIMEALIRAAERGVRVRLLLDDMYSPENEAVIIGLDAHPRIQVRVFNPFHVRGNAPLGRAAEFLAGDGRVNRRMHNKLFLADNHFGITGGRNIGDEYFQANGQLAFRDLDVMAVGPVVTQLSQAFDQYWNAPQSITVRAIPMGRARSQLRDELRQEVAALRQDLAPEADEFKSLDALGSAPGPGWGPWTGGDAEVLVDHPDKTLPTSSGPSAAVETLPYNQLLRHGLEVRKELLIVSPYFVPGAKGVARLEAIRAQGDVRIRVLTNSLAATDVTVVHAGYARYRKPLLEAGVELFELKPVKESSAWGRRLVQGSSRASLHGKAVVFDRKVAYVGSMNLDPRSVSLNTESGLILHGEALAGQVAAFIEEAMQPSLSYRLALEAGPGTEAADTRLVWYDQKKNHTEVHEVDPRSNPVLRMYIRLLSLLPIEESL